MGCIKRLGLAGSAAALAVALMGVGTASGTLLCTSEPEVKGAVLKCPEKSAYGVEITPEQDTFGGLYSNATFESTEGAAGIVTCSESTFLAGFKSNGTSEPGEGLVSTSFTSGGGGACTSTFNGAEQPKVFVTTENLSYDGSKAAYVGVASPQGTLTVAKSGGVVQVKMEVKAKTPFTCIYRLQAKEELIGNWANGTGGGFTKLTFTKRKFEKFFGGAACPTKGAFSAVYVLTAVLGETNIYIANE